MAVTFRTAGAWGAGKGSNLVAAEVDGNFWDHEERIVDVEAAVAATPAIPDAADVPFDANTGNGLLSSNVQDAIDEVVALLTTMGFDAFNVSYDPSSDSELTSTNVRDALDELGIAISAGGSGSQPIDDTLTALAGLSATAGFVVQTAADVFTKREITGAFGISITDGDGVADDTLIEFVPSSLNEDTAPSLPNDYVVTYDTSAGVPKKVIASRIAPVEIIVACSDETTALTTGTAKVTFRMPHAMTLTSVRGSLATAQSSGSILTVDIKESGTTIFSTKLTIDNTEKTTATAATASVISDTALADDAEITVNIDQVGDGTAKGLKIVLIGRRA